MSQPDGAKLMAASAYERACDRDDDHACERLEQLLSERIDAPIAKTMAEHLASRLSTSCDRGDDEACAIGLDVAETWEVQPLAERLGGALSRRCHEGSANACLQLLESGDEETESEEALAARIVALGRAHCASGAEVDCMAVKRLTERQQREDVRSEARRRAKLTSVGAPLRDNIDQLQAACAKKDATGCIDLATMYILFGMRTTARHVFDNACNDAPEHGVLCWNAFLMAKDFEVAPTTLENEPWATLGQACKGGVSDACGMQKFGGLLGNIDALTPALVDAIAKGEPLAFGVVRLVVEKGGGLDVGEHDRVLVRASWFATDGAPLQKTSKLVVVSVDRGDSLAEALRDTRVGARVLARISPGPLSELSVPVIASLDVVAVLPRAPVREPPR